MINQRLYPDIILGSGSANQTIALYGCYECALLQGLLDRGYKYTVGQFDKLLTDRKCFSQNVLLSSTAIQAGIPEIFLEGRNEAWNDANFIKYLKDKSYIMLGEVDARGIGGSGQHFVYIQDADIVDGKIKMSYVGDPWDGLDRQKITTRYGAFKNILSLRVFRVKLVEDTNMPNMYEGYDLANPESMKVCVDLKVKQDKGLIVDKKVLDDKVSELTGKIDQARKDGYNDGNLETVKSVSRELGLPGEITTTEQLVAVLRGLIDQPNSGGGQNGSQTPFPPKVLKLADGDEVTRNGIKWLPGGQLEASYQENK